MKKIIEKVINVAYCVGASIVIFGALTKIIHQPYADTFLTAGLLTECVLFLFMGYQELVNGKVEGPDHIAGAAGNNDEVVAQIKETKSILKKVYR